MATKKNAKKVAAPKPAKVAKPVKATVKKSSVKFVSFSVRGVIPTMAYGNIQPEITVQAATYEEAKDFVMPLMEGLFAQYSETKPTFLGKITETTKIVSGTTTSPAAQTNVPATVPQPHDTPAPVTTNAAGSPGTNAPAAGAQMPTAQKSEAVQKAEKKISMAMSDDAVQLIQDQIEASVKISAEDKPALITLCLHKRNEFKGK